MSQVALIVKLVAKEGQRADLAQAFSAAFPHVATESDTRYYILHEDTGNADALWIYEMYESKAGQDAHGAADWFKPFQGTLGAFIAGVEFIGLNPVGGKGL